MRTTEIEQHYRYASAAEMLSLSVDTLQRAVAEGERSRGQRGIHPVRRVGKTVLLPASSINKWLGRS